MSTSINNSVAKILAKLTRQNPRGWQDHVGEMIGVTGSGDGSSTAPTIHGRPFTRVAPFRRRLALPTLLCLLEQGGKLGPQSRELGLHRRQLVPQAVKAVHAGRGRAGLACGGCRRTAASR